MTLEPRVQPLIDEAGEREDRVVDADVGADLTARSGEIEQLASAAEVTLSHRREVEARLAGLGVEVRAHHEADSRGVGSDVVKESVERPDEVRTHAAPGVEGSLDEPGEAVGLLAKSGYEERLLRSEVVIE